MASTARAARSSQLACARLEVRPLILSARLDAAAQTFFDSLRKEHFPPERNFLAAHLTLFHALPGSEMEQIDLQLSSSSQPQFRMAGTAAGVRSLGHGVAFDIDCAELSGLRTELAMAWRRFLGAQDRQKWRPHVTIQNKVRLDAAQRLLRQLSQRFHPMPLSISGLDLWHYDGGPWELAHPYEFRSREAVPAGTAG